MKRRTASRLAWSLFAFFVALAAAGSILQQSSGGASLDDYTSLVTFTLTGVFGTFIASRRPENPIGWMFCAISFLAAVGFIGFEYATYGLVTEPGSLPAARLFAWLGLWPWIPSIGTLGTFLLLLFPNGRLPSPRWRPVAWACGVLLAALTFMVATFPGPIEGLKGVRNPLGLPVSRQVMDGAIGIAFLFVTVLALVSAASMVVRFRRARGEERLQLKWFTLAAVFAAVGIFVGDWLPIPENVGAVIFSIALIGLPASATIAIARYRLYDIDLVINKTVVYGVLAVFITAVYVAIVVGIGALVGSSGNVVLSILATAIIAVAFQPVRQRARHLANRLVYGKRATPYEVLSEFAGRVAGIYSSEDVLPRMARILGEGSGATRAEVWVRVGNRLRPEAVWPPATTRPAPRSVSGDDLPPFDGVDVVVPVRHEGGLLGALAVTKPPNEPLTPTDEKLVADLAAQAGLVLRNARLIEELRASRQRLVAAQDEERRRIERNIHDGAQQQLVALSVKLRLAKSLARKDLDDAERLLEELGNEAQDALENLRDLARGIYPPLLADRGLPAALEAQARKSPLPVAVNSSGVGRYGPDVEATVYFCALEALQNVAKYAEASRVTVRLAATDGSLTFEVSDDGRGFDPGEIQHGTGLQSMADRLDSISGSIEVTSAPGQGTTVRGTVPVREIRP